MVSGGGRQADGVLGPRLASCCCLPAPPVVSHGAVCTAQYRTVQGRYSAALSRHLVVVLYSAILAPLTHTEEHDSTNVVHQ